MIPQMLYTIIKKEGAAVKRIHFPIYSIIAFVMVFLFSAFVFIADRLLDKGIYFYTGQSGFTTGVLFVTMFVIGSVLFVSAIAVFLHKNVEIKWIKITVTILSALISVIFVVMVVISAVLFMPQTYVELSSYDEAHNIIIGEDCYLFSPYGGDIFEKTSFCTMKKLGKYVAEKDFYMPFSDGNYSVIWNNDSFELFYDSDGDGELDKNMLIDFAR